MCIVYNIYSLDARNHDEDDIRAAGNMVMMMPGNIIDAVQTEYLRTNGGTIGQSMSRPLSLVCG